MGDLVDVPTEELVKEMQRRLECQYKPEKHVILVGMRFLLHFTDTLITHRHTHLLLELQH